MTLQEYHGQIDLAYQTLHGNDIRDRLTELLDRCAQEHGTGSSAYASLLSELGSYYRGQREYTISEEYFVKALDLLEKTAGTCSAEYATALNNLAGTYRGLGEREKAESVFLRALDIYERSLGKKHILYASALNNISLLYLDENKLDTAERYLCEAGEILAQMPEHKDEYATHLVNLGNVYLRNKKTGEARSFLKKAVGLYENDLGTDTPHYHSALNSLGIACCIDGDYVEAREHLKKAETAVEALFGEDHAECLAIRKMLKFVEMKESENDGTDSM